MPRRRGEERRRTVWFRAQERAERKSGGVRLSVVLQVRSVRVRVRVVKVVEDWVVTVLGRGN